MPRGVRGKGAKVKLGSGRKVNNVENQDPGPADHNSSGASVASSTATAIGMSSLASISEADSGLTPQLKAAIVEFIKESLNDCQRLGTRERKAAYNQFRRMYYRNKNPNTFNDFQKYITQTLWTVSLLFFKAPNGEPVRRALSFILQVIMNAGTADDIKDAGVVFADSTKTIIPMHYYILKLWLQCHMDERALVRFRVISIVSEILGKYKDEPLIQANKHLWEQLKSAFLTRISDRFYKVRAISAKMLIYFQEDLEVVKRLKYFGRFDPNAEVRRVVVRSLMDVPSVKTAFFYDFIFDSDAKVRVEAFSVLSTKRMGHLKQEECTKAIVWGLRTGDMTRAAVMDKLLPAWLEQCNKDPLEFMRALNIERNPSIISTVMDGIYKNNYTETFEEVDRSFLNEDKVIPIQDLSVEKVMFWVYLIKKFCNTRHNQERLLPEPDRMIQYLRENMAAIHEENRKAREEDRDEDGTLIICITYFISIALKIGIDVGFRRRLEAFLKDVLLDPVMDEGPLCVMCVETLNKILDKRNFSETMAEIFQKVFEPDHSTENDGTLTPHRSRSASRRKTGNASNVISIAMQHVSENQNDMSQAGRHQEDDEPVVGSAGSNKSSKRQWSEADVLRLKNKLCDLALQRLKLGREKENALKAANFMEANRLHNEIEATSKEHNRIEQKLKMFDGRVASLSDFTMSSQATTTTNNPNETSMMELEAEEPDIIPGSPPILNSTNNTNHTDRTIREDEVDDVPCSQEPASVGITSQNMLKGVIMINRYLSCNPRISPFIRQFYSDYALSNFTDAQYDSSIRKELLKFMVTFGNLDKPELRKVTSLLIVACMQDQDPEVRDTAFGGIVDLLCLNEFKRFMRSENEEELPAENFPEFNKFDATVADMQNMFMSLVGGFGSRGMQTAQTENLKVGGILKLLLKDRISSESVVMNTLCLWCEPRNRGTKIPDDIGSWLPVYARLSLGNARILGNALFFSIIRIVNAQEKLEKDNTLLGADYMKLVDFVLPYLSTSHVISKDGEYVNIHEELYSKVMEQIREKTKQSVNIELMNLLPKLKVDSETEAERFVAEMATVLAKVSSMPQTDTMKSLRSQLVKSGKKLVTTFSTNETIVKTWDDAMALQRRPISAAMSDSEEEAEENPFSDDEDLE